MYKRLAAYTALVGISILVVNTLAHVFYWYVSIWWFDMLMHTIGGVFVALVCSMVLLKHIKFLPSKETFITIALFVFIIGLAWEYYEYVVQYYVKGVQLASVADSLSDLICDMIGGSVGALFVIWTKKRYNRT